MADALCGPSNPLQTFQKQSSADRTLHQDRLAARQSSSEGFRSPPGPNAGTLDAEFEAFQAGFPLGPAVLEPQLFLQGPMTHPLAPNHGQQQIPKWASDFQNLQLNEPQTSQSQYHQHALLQHSNPTSWHHDYLSQSDTNLSHQGQQPQRPTGQKYSGRPYGYTGDLTLPHGNRLFSIAQQKQSEDQSEGVFDEAAFDRAFDAAGEELQDVTRQFPQNDSHINGQSHYTENREETVAMSGENDVWRSDEISSIIELLNRGMSWDGIGQQMGRSASSCRLYYERFLEYRARSHGQAWPDHSRIGSDRIAEEVWDRKQEHKEADDGEELARTAGRLLENVKGDQSQKFQKSNFLSLMRQFRDKEVRVEGDTLVGTTQPLHPGGENYPSERVADHDGSPDARGLMLNNPGDLSDSQSQSFQQQNPAVQQKPVQVEERNFPPKTLSDDALQDYQMQLMILEQQNKKRGSHALQDYQMQPMLLEQQNKKRGSHALQDYQMQLMILEQHNKKRLIMARRAHEIGPWRDAPQ